MNDRINIDSIRIKNKYLRDLCYIYILELKKLYDSDDSALKACCFNYSKEDRNLLHSSMHDNRKEMRIYEKIIRDIQNVDLVYISETKL